MKHYKINHHLHSTGSDGSLTPEKVIKLAIEKNMDFICFTDHYPFPPGYKEWGRSFHSEEYYKEVMLLIKKYQKDIEISFGAEFNWVEGSEEWTKNEINKRKYDYILGSIHDIKLNNQVYDISAKQEEITKAINDFGSLNEFILEYYRQIKLMIKSSLFDSIGHMDLIKIWSPTLSKELEKESWYKKEIKKVLDLAKVYSITIEINTGGFRRPCNEQYPSFWIIKEMNKRNIPITIGIDSHYENQMDNDYDKAIELAKKAGYTSIVKYKNRKRIDIKI